MHLMDDTLPRKDGSFPTGIMKWNNEILKNTLSVPDPFRFILLVFLGPKRSHCTIEINCAYKIANLSLHVFVNIKSTSDTVHLF